MGETEAEKPPLQNSEITRNEARAALVIALIDKVPWIVTSVAVIAVAALIAGKETVVDLNFVANLSLSVAIPLGLLKIYLDRKQKIRLRDRVTDLELENRELRQERDEFRGELRALSRPTQGEPSVSESQSSGG